MGSNKWIVGLAVVVFAVPARGRADTIMFNFDSGLGPNFYLL